MRIAVAALFVLAGCASVREGLGEIQKAGDRGLEVPVSAAAPAGEARAEAKGGLPELPAGLGGDSANRSYSSAPPQR